MFYSPCVSALFRGQPADRTLERVKAAGFTHYEFWGWWDQDVDALARAQRRTGLMPAALCTRMISLLTPDTFEAYRSGLEETAAVCRRLGCKTVITQTGQELKNLPRAKQHENLVEGLKRCVSLLEANGLTLVVEPLNTRVDHPGYYLQSSEEAFQIVDEVGSERVRILFDLYHQHITEGLSIDRILKNLDKIGHFHIAGYPGRHEPFEDNEIDYMSILTALDRAGYRQGIGLEYFPALDVDTGLKSLMAKVNQI